MSSAISFGVLRRLVPSTRAIMRSRKLAPGSWVIRTTIRSESTRVPPVTALRSPPDSRITGADSPVIADSSTEAMPSTTSPSPGIGSPASQTTRSPGRSSAAGTRSSIPASLEAARHHAAARRAQRVGLRAAAALGDRLGQVGEEDREPQPERDDPGEPEAVGPAPDQVGDEDAGGQRAADLDHEHDRLAHLHPRVELADRGAGRR